MSLNLNFIMESNASWCTAAEIARSTFKVSWGPTVRKSPTLSVQQYHVQMAIAYLYILLANINNRFSGKVVELVVSASVFNPALFPDDGTLLRAYSNSKLANLANF